MVSVTTSIRDLNELNPYVMVRAEKWIKQCQNASLDVRISETYRTNERQSYLYSLGLSTVQVTGAHGFRVALDFFFVENGKTAYPVAKMKAAAQIAKIIGFEWGGDWTSFQDMPHLQLLGGITLAQYRQGKRPSWYYKTVEQAKKEMGEDDTITQDDFNKMMNEYLRQKSLLQPDDWAKNGWQKASNTPAVDGSIAPDGSPLKIVDGTNPQGFISRQELIAIIQRVGII